MNIWKIDKGWMGCSVLLKVEVMVFIGLANFSESFLPCKKSTFWFGAKQVRLEKFCWFLQWLKIRYRNSKGIKTFKSLCRDNHLVASWFPPASKSKREYINWMVCDRKYIHSRKYIYQIEKCKYVMSQNGMSHKKENEM